MSRKRLVGTGILTREKIYFGTEGSRPTREDVDEYVDWVFENSSAIQRGDGRWAGLVKESKDLLVKVNLPNRSGYYYAKDNKLFRWEKSDDRSLWLMKFVLDPLGAAKSEEAKDFFVLPKRIMSLEDIAKKCFGEDSGPHFAAQFVTLEDQLAVARREKQWLLCEFIAFRLGELKESYRLKLSVESTWKIGRKVKTGGRKGADARHTLKAAQRERVISTLTQYLQNDLPLMEARDRTAKKHGISIRTVQRHERTQNFHWTLPPSVQT